MGRSRTWAPGWATIGKEVKRLATVEQVGGKAVAESDLVVTYSYYAAAQGSWRPRDPAATEPWCAAWGTKTGDLYLNEAVFVRDVPEFVSRYELGGYPVLKKCLGYRDANRRGGAPLRLAEVDHLMFRQIVRPAGSCEKNRRWYTRTFFSFRKYGARLPAVTGALYRPGYWRSSFIGRSTVMPIPDGGRRYARR